MTDTILCPVCKCENYKENVLCRKCRHALDLKKAKAMGYKEDGTFDTPPTIPVQEPLTPTGTKATIQDWREEVERQGQGR